jgi:hypothetical protein
MAEKPGFGPAIPGLSKTISPLTPKDMIGDLLSKIAGGGPGPRLSAGDKVAQAVQLLREASQEDPRIAPLVGGALQSLVTGSGQGGPGQSLAPVEGPVPQAAGGMADRLAAMASMMPPGAA